MTSTCTPPTFWLRSRCLPRILSSSRLSTLKGREVWRFGDQFRNMISSRGSIWAAAVATASTTVADRCVSELLCFGTLALTLLFRLILLVINREFVYPLCHLTIFLCCCNREWFHSIRWFDPQSADSFWVVLFESVIQSMFCGFIQSSFIRINPRSADLFVIRASMGIGEWFHSLQWFKPRSAGLFVIPHYSNRSDRKVQV